MYEKRDLLGKLLFGVAILILLYMFVSPLTNIIINVDEYWTYSLVNLPFMQGMIVAVHDVHPPLHYWILYLLTPLGLDNLYLIKVVSIIPYALLIIVSYFKIRKNYGWLTAGLFVFSLGVMSDFFVEFLTIRMYSWGIFFLVMAFIYYGEVLEKWDKKSWILLTIFTLLCAYTQYFFAITCALMYAIILVEILKNHKDKLRDFAKSVVAMIILYAPWGVIFIYQLLTQSEDVHESFGLSKALYYITAYAIKSEDVTFEMIVLKVLAFLFLIFILVMAYRQKDRFSASSIFLMYATMLVGITTLMFSFCNTMRIRYLVPVFGLVWLSASIVIGRIENDKILAVALIVIIVFAGASVAINIDDINSRLAFNDERESFLESINNNSSVIVYNTDYGYKILHNDLNKTKQYSLGDKYFYDSDTEINNNLTNILDKNRGKNVYLINWKNPERNVEYEKNYDLETVYDAGHYSFNLVKG